jgi:hypothetical protein
MRSTRFVDYYEFILQEKQQPSCYPFRHPWVVDQLCQSHMVYIKHKLVSQ